MTEVKTSMQGNEREYVIPLRSSWMKSARYKRSRKAIMTIKEFVARHMRIPDRDLSKVKLDVHLNNDIWFRGCKKPPAKVKVRVKRDGEFVRVEFAEIPEYVKFAKAKEERRHKKADKKKEVKTEEIKPTEEKSTERKEEDKKNLEEKEKSMEKMHEKVAEQQAKAQKHLTKVKEPIAHRKALKK